MEALLSKIPDIIEVLSLVMTGVVVLATFAVQLTPTKSDNEAVGKYSGYLLRILKYFPTLGVNPHTAKLQKTLEGLSGDTKKPEVEVVTK